MLHCRNQQHCGMNTNDAARAQVIGTKHPATIVTVVHVIMPVVRSVGWAGH